LQTEDYLKAGKIAGEVRENVRKKIGLAILWQKSVNM